MADVNINIKVNDSGAVQKIDRLANATKQVDGRVKRLNSTLSRSSQIFNVFAGNVAAVGFSKLISGISELGASSLKVTGELETLRTQFEVLTGSAGTANKAIQDLQEFAATTPFQFKDLARAQQRLLSFGFTVEESKDNLVDLGDVAAASGADIGELALIFGQVQAAGKLTGERLLQLQERAIPIGPAIAQSLGVAESSVRDLVSQGKVSFKEFEEAFKSLNDVGEFAFEGTIKRSQTLEGRLSTLSDNFELLQANIGQRLAPAFKAILSTLTLFIQRIQNTSFFNNLLETIGNSIPTVINFAVDSFSFLINTVLNAAKIFNLFRSGVTTAVSTISFAFTELIATLSNAVNAFGLSDTALGRSLNAAREFGTGVTSALDDTAAGFAESAAEIDASQQKVNQAIGQSKEFILQSYSEEKMAAEEQASAIEDSNNRIIESEKELTEATLAEQKKLQDAQLSLNLAREAARLEELGNDQIFQEQKLIALQEFFTAEQEAAIQAKINLAQTETEKQTLIIQAQAQGIAQRQEAKRIELEELRKAEDGYTKFLQKEAETRESNQRSTLGRISTLSQSSSKELAIIGKAAGLTQIAIDTPVAVGRALAAFPPPFNFAAAAAVGAAMAAQAARLTGIGFEQGGIVPGTSFTGDRVAANVNSGEMILNRQQQAELFKLANGAAQNAPPQEIVVQSTIMLNDEIVGEAVSRQVANGLVLGEVQ